MEIIEIILIIIICAIIFLIYYEFKKIHNNMNILKDEILKIKDSLSQYNQEQKEYIIDEIDKKYNINTLENDKIIKTSINQNISQQFDNQIHDNITESFQTNNTKE